MNLPYFAARPVVRGNGLYADFFQAGPIGLGTYFREALHSPLVLQCLQELRDRGIAWDLALITGTRYWEAGVERGPRTTQQVEVTPEMVAEWDDARRVACWDPLAMERLETIESYQAVEFLLLCALGGADEWVP